MGFAHAAIASVPGRQTTQGPDGADAGGGYVFDLQTPPGLGAASPQYVKFDPEGGQTWRKCYDGKLWLGWENGQSPRPVDLQRSRTVTGVGVELCDGNTWVLPQIRTIDGMPAVETVIGLDASGKVVLDMPAPHYASLWSLIAVLMGADPLIGFEALRENTPIDNTVEAVVGAMSLNYRMSKWEFCHLGLMTTTSLPRAFGTIAGMTNEQLDTVLPDEQ
jgi:hypothetical protein